MNAYKQYIILVYKCCSKKSKKTASRDLMICKAEKLAILRTLTGKKIEKAKKIREAT